MSKKTNTQDNVHVITDALPEPEPQKLSTAKKITAGLLAVGAVGLLVDTKLREFRGRKKVAVVVTDTTPAAESTPDN